MTLLTTGRGTLSASLQGGAFRLSVLLRCFLVFFSGDSVGLATGWSVSFKCAIEVFCAYASVCAHSCVCVCAHVCVCMCAYVCARA
jgi:hypothetical protein